MNKYYDVSKIKDIKNKDINIVIKPYRKINNNYIYASKLFNDKYKDKYKINNLSPEEILKAMKN